MENNIHPNDKLYQEIKVKVKQQVKDLMKNLVKLDNEQKKQPKNGGFAGSLGYVSENLKDINNFLTGNN